MPLAPGKSKAVISANIREMIENGHPQKVAVAAALHNARQTRAHGGTLSLPKIPKPPTTPKIKLHVGPIHSTVAGRTDHLPMHVPEGSYVIPADIISGAMGEGNTLAGFKVAKSIFSRPLYTPQKTPYGVDLSGAPYGQPMPKRATGGAVRGVPIVAAGGEYVLDPDDVAHVGGGNLDDGHKILDEFVKQMRSKLIKTTKSLPGPAK